MLITTRSLFYVQLNDSNYPQRITFYNAKKVEDNFFVPRLKFIALLHTVESIELTDIENYELSVLPKLDCLLEVTTAHGKEEYFLHH